MIKNKIINLLESKIKINHIDIKDLTKKHINHIGYDGGGHYKVTIISNDFKNITLIKRHKMIYSILDSMIKKEIHALSLKTLTLKEYKKITSK